MQYAIFLVLCTLTSIVQAFELKAGPYLQSVTPTSATIRMEATFSGAPSILFFRENETEKIEVIATLIERDYHADKKIALYEAKLSGLMSGALYFYQLKQGAEKSATFHFRTLLNRPHSFAFLALSDAQSGHKVTTKVVAQSVMKYAFASYPDEHDFPISFALFTGDLVQKGHEYPRWNQEFFAPLGPLMTRLNLYPAVGNHEENTPYYFSYFELPRNGTPDHLEQWYYFDYQNVRIITLNSNPPYDNEVQLSWLETILQETEHLNDIDFVLLQIHHPAESELWLAGESAFSKSVNTKLSEFSQKSKKPVVALSGHTHGYSRGHDPEHLLTMLINGSIGGATDNWGEFKQKDYLNYVMTKDEFGWCLIQVTIGDEATMSFKRYSFGKDGDVKDQGLVDSFTLRKHNISPDAPTLNLGADSINADPYRERQGDPHLTTQWQASATLGMDKIFWNRTNHAYNEYGGTFTDLKQTLTTLLLKEITSTAKTIFVRARYRDSALGYSEWSSPLKVDLK